MKPMRPIAELRGHEADLGRERSGVPLSGGHVERRALPRPKPEHVVSLAEDLAAARNMLSSGSGLDHAGGVATIAVVENALKNLAEAMRGARR